MTQTYELLQSWRGGDRAALDALTPVVYNELRRLAASYLKNERPGHTLQATALVHEAYLRLLGQQNVDWKDKAHLLAMAATMMRRILVDHARSRQAMKRGWDGRVTLDEERHGRESRAVAIIALDEAMNQLKTLDSRQAEIVELKYFGGLSIEETGAVLEVSPSTVKREWRMARAWLRSTLGRG